MNDKYRRKHLIAYIVFLVLLAIDYFLIPTEHFYEVLWVLLILFIVVDGYLLLTSKKKK